MKLIAKIPEGNALNGMAGLYGGTSDTILVVDSYKAAIWKLNITTGEYSDRRGGNSGKDRPA